MGGINLLEYRTPVWWYTSTEWDFLVFASQSSWSGADRGITMMAFNMHGRNIDLNQIWDQQLSQVCWRKGLVRKRRRDWRATEVSFMLLQKQGELRKNRVSSYLQRQSCSISVNKWLKRGDVLPGSWRGRESSWRSLGRTESTESHWILGQRCNHNSVVQTLKGWLHPGTEGVLMNSKGWAVRSWIVRIGNESGQMRTKRKRVREQDCGSYCDEWLRHK